MSMHKKFSINLFFLLCLNFLVKPIYLFGIEVGVQNRVGAEQYGLYYAMFNFTFLFNVLLDLGINNYQKIKVAQHAESGMQNMTNLVPIKLVMALVYVLVSVATAAFFGFENRYWYFIGWLLLNHILSNYLLLIRANLSGLHLFMKDSILSVTDRFVLIIGVGYLLFFEASTFIIERFVQFQSISYIMAIILGLLFTPASQRFFKLDFSLKPAIKIARQSWPFALLILLMTAYYKLDGFMLERLAQNGLLEAGIYAQAFRLLDAGNNFAFLYAGMLLPMFARLFVDDFLKISILVNQAARLLIIPAGIVAILTIFHSEYFMELLYHEHIAQSASSLIWLMGSFVWMAISYVYGTLLTASAKLKYLNGAAMVTLLLNVILNLTLIPNNGASGAALASFISLGLMALLQIWICHKRYSTLSVKWIKPAFIVWSILLISTMILKKFDVNGWHAVAISAFFAAITFMVVAVDFSELKAMVSNKLNH